MHPFGVCILLTLLAVIGVVFLLHHIACNADAYAVLEALDRRYWRPAATSVARTPFHETGDVPWCRTRRAATAVIQQEWDAFMASHAMAELPMFGDIFPQEKRLSGAYDRTPGKWRTVVLRVYGRDTDAAARFPATHRLIRRVVPACTTAMFSVLEPGRGIPSHRGPNHAVLRYHLGVRVPTDWQRCSITVAGTTRHWREGDDLLFDDTLPHHVENTTSEPRVVLFLDVPRTFAGTAVAARFTRFVAYQFIFPHHPLVVSAAERASPTHQEKRKNG